MIKAVIENKDGGTLVTEFPCDIYNLYSELHSVGVTKRPNDVKLTDNEDDHISVKLYKFLQRTPKGRNQPCQSVGTG